MVTKSANKALNATEQARERGTSNRAWEWLASALYAEMEARQAVGAPFTYYAEAYAVASQYGTV